MKSVKSAAVVPTVQTVAQAAIAIIDREVASNGKQSDERRMVCNGDIIADAIADIDYALRSGLYQGFRTMVRLPIIGKCGHMDLHNGEYSLRIAIRGGRMTFATLETREGWSYNVTDGDVEGLHYVLTKLAKAG